MALAAPIRVLLGRRLRRWRRALRRGRNWAELARFSAVGASGYVLNLAVYVALVQAAGAAYRAAAVGSFCVAVTNNYAWNRAWTFRGRRGHIGRQAARFLLVSLAALALNLVVLTTLIGFGFAKVPAQALAIVLVTPVSFLGNRLWSFGHAPAREARGPDGRGLAWVLWPCAGVLAILVVVWDFLMPQTPARLAHPSAELIGRLGLWSAIAHVDAPVPSSRTAIAAVVLASTALGFAAYAIALRACWNREATRTRLAAVVGTALLFFTTTAVALPTLNTDIYEYIATGRIAAHHASNPYAVPADRFARDPVYRYTDRRYTSIPGDNKLAAWTLVSVGAAKLAGHDVVTSLLAYRMLLLACAAISLLLVVRLLRRLNPRAQLAGVVAYGWNPVVIIAAPTKVDSLMVTLLLAGALALVTAHRRLGAVWLALSALVKLITLPLIAVHWLGQVRQRRWSAVAVDSALMAATIVAVYAPFAGAPGLVSRELGLLQTGGGSPLRSAVALAFAGLIAGVGWRQDGTPRRLMRGWAVVSLAFAALLPNLGFSWYLLVPIAVTAVAASGPLLAIMTAITAASFAIGSWHLASREPFPLTAIVGAAAPALATIAVLASACIAVVAIVARRRVGAGSAPAPTPPARSQSGEPWLVLPTYNEAENLEMVVAAARAALASAAPGGFRILVVDDDSPDGTGAIADRLAAEHEEIRVLHRVERDGLGPAYLAGFARALDEGASFVFEMDADGSHDPRDLARLLGPVRDGGTDLALGSRYVPGGGVSDWGALRRLVSRGGSWYARRVLGLEVRDLTGGFKCFRRAVLEAIDLPTVRARGYAFQVELTHRAVRAGFRVVETPIVFRDRQLGKSKMSWRIALEALWLVPLLRWGAERRRPLPARLPPGRSAGRPALAPAAAGLPSTVRLLAVPSAPSRATLAGAAGYAALAAMVAVSGLLGAGAATSASFLVPSVHPVLPDWISGVLPELGATISHGALFVALLLLTIGYALVLLLWRSLSAVVVIGAIVVLHAIFLLAPPLLSSDIFSYVAYGRLGAVHDISPYVHGPAAAPHDPVFRYVAGLWAHTPSAYGPLFTIGSYGLIGLGTVGALWGFKAVAAIASLAVVALVWGTAKACGRDPVRAAAIVGLNPLLLVYAVGGGHNDLLMLALTMLGVLLACSAHEGAGAASIVAGAAVKASAIVVLPFMLLRTPRSRTAFLGSVGAGLAIAVLAAAVFDGGAFGFVSVLMHAHLVTSTSIASDVSALVGGIPHLRALGLVAGVTAFCALLWRVWRGMDWMVGAGWALLLVACAASALFGWYTIWPLPFAAVTGDRRLLAATLFVQVLFVIHLLPAVVA